MKTTIRDNYRIELTPDTSWHRRGIADDHNAMRGLLEEIERAVKRHVDGVYQVLPRWDSRDVCSHCDCGWEVLTAEEAADASTNQDEHSVEGEPVCCEKAIDEFRAERGIPLLDAGVVAYRNPDRPDVLLCREHGKGWAGLKPLTSEDLPDGGICTYGQPNDNECGRDVLAAEEGAAA